LFKNQKAFRFGKACNYFEHTETLHTFLFEKLFLVTLCMFIFLHYAANVWRKLFPAKWIGMFKYSFYI